MDMAQQRTSTSSRPVAESSSPEMTVGPDGYAYANNAPLATGHRYLDAFLEACVSARVGPKDMHWVEAVSQQIAQKQGVPTPSPDVVIAAIVERGSVSRDSLSSNPAADWFGLLGRLLDYQFDVRWSGEAPSAEQVDRVLRPLVAAGQRGFAFYCWRDMLPIIERTLHESALTPERQRLIWQLTDNILTSEASYYLDDDGGAPTRHTLEQLDIMTGRLKHGLTRAGDRWGDLVIDEITTMTPSARSVWTDLIHYALTATKAKPTKAWLRGAETRVNAVGWHAYEQRMLAWLAEELHRSDLPVHDRNATILRGLIWCCTLRPSSDLIRAVATLAEVMFTKLPGFGARSSKVGNACISALMLTSGREAIAQLTRLKARVKGHAHQEMIHKALSAIAAAQGVSPDELEELSVPTFDLNEMGSRHEQVGDTIATITIMGTQKVQLTWIDRDGKAQATIPTHVKRDHPSEVSKLKATVQDMTQALSVQRTRLEGLFLRDVEWTLPRWRECYVDHPLLGHMSRRLIWQFSHGITVAEASYADGDLLDVDDQPLDWLSNACTVRLWHPIGSSATDVERWRLWLERHKVTQPFKQAHREVYRLTDAECQTPFQSRRFEGHVIRQHQFSALCRERRWRYQLQGGFEPQGEIAARRLLPLHHLQAELYIDAPAGDKEPMSGNIYLYVDTSFVQFANLDGQPQPLLDIPAVAFSEIMRDVDLFVSISSIGNDPLWPDQGRTRLDYWRGYATGPLMESARIRRDTLLRLLPTLPIADRCHVADPFMVVRGDVNTYKIHLGSTVVLAGASERVLPLTAAHVDTIDCPFIPFEGDDMTSLLLGKATLLAHDARIMDPILSEMIRSID